MKGQSGRLVAKRSSHGLVSAEDCSEAALVRQQAIEQRPTVAVIGNTAIFLTPLFLQPQFQQLLAAGFQLID